MARRGATVGLALVLAAAAASAQVPAGTDPVLAARTVGYEGVEAFQAGNYVLADQKLNHAYRLLPVPSLGLWSARALVKLGRPVEASARLAEVTRSTLLAGDADVQRQAQAEAKAELAALLPSIPSLELRIEGAGWDGLTLLVDGIDRTAAAREGALPVNPGERLIEARRGAQLVTRRIIAQVSQRETVVLSFAGQEGLPAAPTSQLSSEGAAVQPLAAEPQSAAEDAWRTAGWVGVGVGGSALLASGVLALVAYDRSRDFDCNDDPCTSPDRDAVDGYNALVTASTVGYLAGGVLAGAGALVLLRHSLWGSDVKVELGGHAVAVRGRF